ncbi:ATP-binding protein [Streptomyces sp. NPDC002889]|uniref:ATP-binding protein n=1 Tax=Streptomyces sp. NPDC002889 TaxID=3364669 RepID=UPI0036C23B31
MSQTRRFPLDGGPGVVGRCRDLTRQVLQEWSALTGPAGRVLTADIVLLVSEIVTNSCRHGGAPYELRIDRAPGLLWVQVSDTSPKRPVPRGTHRAGRVSGHGLYLLERLSEAWGWMPRGTGKAVWFVVATPK